MTRSDLDPVVNDEIPWSDEITEYDERHLVTYLRLLDAERDKASPVDMARIILGIEPSDEPERADRAVRSHLLRAHWMMETGYMKLLAGAKK